MKEQYYVYVLTNKNNRVLYPDVTGNLINRIYQHRNGMNPGFRASIIAISWCILKVQKVLNPR